MPVVSLIQGQYGNLDDIFRLTDTQVSLLAHASIVSSERDEERRKRERTCSYCKTETISGGKCATCKRNKQGIKIAIEDKIEWPPNSGNFYVGDGKVSAVQKLKKADPRSFMDYNNWVMQNAFRR